MNNKIRFPICQFAHTHTPKKEEKKKKKKKEKEEGQDSTAAITS